ncbi:hypothetical protein SAMN02744133_105210 [Thalassospira xiamenensis M-5 = DSM 17429]|uniref:Cyclic GMP-AMP synthase n=1 Tax=Thalassospira xiamenensis M-5 = DSM 17429 TaxID=1123366 RepID=A0AB72UHD0_9PROT|nr:hypothetical protein [Thalassospira xiamenensis]AJD53585.1 hypothetical protein TH3_17415 [Thalassospira xiamenensis M-5 = DSM 17429]SIT09367.1 hypothetical protein SAMN02744133_105210 [Thalassospira xiamenensis M-5 = DSM 17429]
MLNLSSLLYSTANDNLLKQLDLEANEKDFISKCKNKVRACIRDELTATLKETFSVEQTVSPKFFTQGSWAYKTLNSPCHTPPQQCDIDDGVYFPLSIMQEEKKPSIASTTLFAAIEGILEKLAKKEGWTLDSGKDTCVRLILTERAHLDIPLYAIPDGAFTQMATEAIDRGYGNFADALSKRDQESWTQLPSDEVLLAHRKEGWITSDPRPIKQWFLDEVDAKGEQLRRVVRYLKSIRDMHWKSGGPSSILLMAASAPLFKRHDKRDDLALLNVLQQLPEHLRNGVNNPAKGQTNESLTDRLSQEELNTVVSLFEKVSSDLNTAIYDSAPHAACEILIGIFGARLPNLPNEATQSAAKDVLAATPVISGPDEPITRTKAG